MTDIIPLSSYQKSRVVLALESSNGQCTILHHIFDMTNLRFKRGVFKDGWLWFEKTNKQETPEQHAKRYALFRRVVHYAIFLVSLKWWDYMEILAQHRHVAWDGITNRRNYKHAPVA